MATGSTLVVRSGSNCSTIDVAAVTLAVDRFHRAFEPGGRPGKRRLPVARMPTDAQRAEFEGSLVVLRRALDPASSRDIADRVARLLLRYGRGDASAEHVVAAYVADLADMPLWAIEQASEAIIDGRTEVSLKYRPSSPELRREVKHAIAKARALISSIEDVLSAQPVVEETPEQRRAALARLKQAHPFLRWLTPVAASEQKG